MVSDTAFIFHMCIPCGKIFLWYQRQGHLSRSMSNIKVRFPTINFNTQGLETYFNMHKYRSTKLLTFLTKIRISEYKHIQGIELHGGQFAYRPRSNRVFSQSV